MQRTGFWKLLAVFLFVAVLVMTPLMASLAVVEEEPLEEMELDFELDQPALIRRAALLAPSAATRGRAVFNTGRNVKSIWQSLAGSLLNIIEVRQYTGSSVPESVTNTRVVSASNSDLEIISWFDSTTGTIFYWSEDPNPMTNASSAYMFSELENAVYLDTTPLDTSLATNMDAMFSWCSSLVSLDITHFDTSNVTSMYCMFYYCSSLVELDVSHLNVSKCTGHTYGSLSGLFYGCSSLVELDLSGFDNRINTSYHNCQNLFTGCNNLEILILGPNLSLGNRSNLSGTWTHEETEETISGSTLVSNYNYNKQTYVGTWVKNRPEGHYYRTDGSLSQTNMWEVHTPDDRFKGYCLNLNRHGVGEYLDRIIANDDEHIERLLCTEEQGSVHGSAPLGDSMREALITLIYYGWPNDGAGIQEKYGLSDQIYMEITQNAVWDFTDRYGNPAGPGIYTGNALKAYQELVTQHYQNIEEDYILHLYESWDPSKQNLLSIMGLDIDEYGGVSVVKWDREGRNALSGAEFSIYDAEGNLFETIVTGANGEASVCRTDHHDGLPLGDYTIKETKAPAGYELSSRVYHFTVAHDNEIETIGWYTYVDEKGITRTVTEEMNFYDAEDANYQGGCVVIQKQSDTGKMLQGTEFTVYDSKGKAVAVIITNAAGVAKTGLRDLPLGKYTVRETKAASGYVKNDKVYSFTISRDSQTVTIGTSVFPNQEKVGTAQFRVQKTLKIPGVTLKGGEFTFDLRDEYGRVIQTMTNDASGEVLFDKITYTPDDLGYHNYTIQEVVGSDTSIAYDRHQEKITVVVDDPGDEASSLECEVGYWNGETEFINRERGESYKIYLGKKQIYTDQYVSGAQLCVQDEGGRTLDTWTSTDEPHEISLESGTYILRELEPPAGFDKTGKIVFQVQEDGTLTSEMPGACSGSDAYLTMYDALISSASLNLQKKDVSGNKALEGAVFTLTEKDSESAESKYHAVLTSDEDGMIRLSGLPTGSYLLTETNPPEGYGPEGQQWTVDLTVNRYIARTSNIDVRGVASGTHPGSNSESSQTITVPGNPDRIHVELLYQTEDNCDYLLLRDKDGNTISKDADGNPIGDTRAAYRGRIWGGLDSKQIRTLEFDLPGDTVTFYFATDLYVEAYGYYAIVTTPTTVVLKDAKKQSITPVDGVYTLTNRALRKIEVQKEWHIADGTIIPDSIQVELLADGKVTQTVTLKKADNWKYTFTNLEKYQADGATLITYTVQEKNAPSGYHVTITGDMDQGFEITNKQLKTVVDDVTLEVQKLVNGHYAGGFDFGLYDTKGDLLARSTADSEGHLVLRSSLLQFDKVGTYIYQIREIPDARNAMVTYDAVPVDLSILVFNNGSYGLDYTVTYTKDGTQLHRAEFENTYTATGTVEISAAKHILGRDWLDGESFLFRLSPVDGAPLRNTEGEEPEYMSARATRQGNDTRAVFEELLFTQDDLLDTEKNMYVQDMDFVYQVEEVIPDDAENGVLNGLKYDTRPQLVTVHVHNDRSLGRLEVTYDPGDTQYATAMDFYNQYTAQSVSVQLQVQKQIVDKHGNLLSEWATDDGEKNWQDTEFTFELSHTREDTPMPEAAGADFATATYTQQNAVFGTITYTEPGVYSYTIRELVPDQGSYAGPECNGLLYDIVDHSVVVRVTDPGDGKLHAEVRYDDEKTEGMTVTNREVADAYLYLAAQKEILGTHALAGAFNFRLREVHEEGKKALGHDHRGTNGEDGYVIFDVLVYDHDDLFLWQPEEDSVTVYYVMEEINDGEPGWTYDSRKIDFRVTILHIHPETGAHSLQIGAVEYSLDQGGTWLSYDGDYPPVFTNSYEVRGEATVDVSKHLSGREWEESDAFEFILTGEDDAPLHVADGNVLKDVDSLSTIATEAHRIVDFPTMIFTMADLRLADGTYTDERTFSYRIHEVAAGEVTDGTFVRNGITIAADQVIQIHVHNREDTGFLSITYTPGANTLEYPRFYNQYEEDGIRTAQLAVRKQLTGRAWQTGDAFTFRLTPLRNSLGIPLEEMPMPTSALITVTADSEAVDETGTVRMASFGDISYTEAGIYEYEIAEVIPEERDDRMNYTEVMHRVVVDIKDRKDGTMSDPVVWYAATESSIPTSFENRYQAEEEEEEEIQEEQEEEKEEEKEDDAPVETDSGSNSFYFCFTKKWVGEPQENLSFTLYNPDGSKRGHRFHVTKISEKEWLYECWLSTGGDYYVIEDVPNGYYAQYENTGTHQDVRDRVYHQGTIINAQAPKTGDARQTLLWTALLLAGLSTLGILIRSRRRGKN